MFRPSVALRYVMALCVGLALGSSPATAAVRLLDSNIDWTTNGSNVQFHLRFDNPDAVPTAPVTGDMFSQNFGVFLPDAGPIGHFDVPPIQPGSFFDVFFDVPLTQLPPNPPTAGGPPPNGPCPPLNHWNGNVDISWSGAGGVGQVNKHFGKLWVCPGGGASLIHIADLLCGSGAALPWSITGLCPGFSATLVNADSTTLAPNPVPPGWNGWIRVTAAPGTAIPDSCCFKVEFLCDGVPGVIDMCVYTCDCSAAPNPTLGTVEWSTITATAAVRFHLRWTNPGTTQPTSPISGSMHSQTFGVFQPDFGPIGQFNVPPIQPNSFFDVFFDVPLSGLPPSEPPINQLRSDGAKGGDPGTGPCTPDDHWNGNVDISWTGPNGSGQVNKHFGKLQVCPGTGASLIHIPALACPSGTATPWTVTGLCPGFSATLVEEDKVTPAPNPVPPGWSGCIRVTAAASVAVPDSCCFQVTFLCDGVPGVIDMCVITCDCGAVPPNPTLGTVDWTTLPGTSLVRFHLHWDNPSPTQSTGAITGNMLSQEFGLFLPNFGPIGSFNVPPIQPNSFFDVFFDVPLSGLPPSPSTSGESGPTGPCPPSTHWDGNVDVIWDGAAGAGEVHKHYGDLTVCAGGGASLIHFRTLTCASPAGMSWSISGLCPGISATLVNEDSTTVAPNPAPPGWTGFIKVTAAVSAAVPDTCCFKVTMLCDNVPGVIDLCAVTCTCAPTPTNPTLGTVEWTTLPAAGAVRFHLRWSNPGPTPTSPVSGTVNSQAFGVFQPDYGPIGQFNVPPIQPNSFFDVFFDVPLSGLPPGEPPINQLRDDQAKGGGHENGPCGPQDHWNGNVDIAWTGDGGSGQVNKHFGELQVCPGTGASLIHIPALVCNGPTGAPASTPWTITGLCPGFSATLVEEDMTTPATNPTPPGWTGFIKVTAAASVAVPDTCCFQVTFYCQDVPGVIDMCVLTCQCGLSGTGSDAGALEFGIRAVVPNPTSGQAAIDFALPSAQGTRLDVFDVSGHRVRNLVDNRLEAGVHRVAWDGRDERGNPLSPGVYFVRLTGGQRTTSEKLVLRR
jgi:hypothetical protein